MFIDRVGAHFIGSGRGNAYARRASRYGLRYFNERHEKRRYRDVDQDVRDFYSFLTHVGM